MRFDGKPIGAPVLREVLRACGTEGEVVIQEGALGLQPGRWVIVREEPGGKVTARFIDDRFLVDAQYAINAERDAVIDLSGRELREAKARIAQLEDELNTAGTLETELQERLESASAEDVATLAKLKARMDALEARLDDGARDKSGRNLIVGELGQADHLLSLLQSGSDGANETRWRREARTCIASAITALVGDGE